MSVELIVSSMLNTQPIKDIVGNKRFINQVQTNKTAPFLVYEIVSAIPHPSTNFLDSKIIQARVEVTALDLRIEVVKNILMAVRDAICDKQDVIFAGKRVLSSRFASSNLLTNDIETKIWMQGEDYLIVYEQ